MGNRDSDVLKGLAAGLVGGLVASWTMNKFQAAWSKRVEGFEKPHGAQSMQPSEGEHEGLTPADKEQQDDAAVKVARAISEELLDRPLPERQKRAAGEAVHYAFGIATGGFYGALAETTPVVTIAAGLPFGVIFWILADETVVPALGLSKGASEYSPSTHAYALASHVVYGVTAELTRRVVRASLDG